MEFQNILNKHLVAALLTVMLGFISSVGLAGDRHHGHGHHHKGHGHHHRGLTILDKLKRTDGAQTLVAAVQLADQPSLTSLLVSQGDCSGLTELLDNRQVQLTLLAPNNNAFEKFLLLPKGGFDGMDIEVIFLALPGILNRLEKTAGDLCNVLLKHVSVGRNSVTTASGLLRRGGIFVADESALPVGVGNVGPSIAYQANITERDVFTANGVIHYLDTVIVEPEPPAPDDPPPPNENDVCLRGKCLADPEQRQLCELFVANCLTEGLREEECITGGLLICNEPPL